MITADAARHAPHRFPRPGQAIGDGSVKARAEKLSERNWLRRLIFERRAPCMRQKTAFLLAGMALVSAGGLGLGSRASHGPAPETACMSPLVLKIAPWLMLVASNVFMTFAWYGHLKHKSLALPVAILSSWMIALPEYMLAVPANRLGSSMYSTAQLKTGQEAITLIVFTLFSFFYLGEAIKWTTLVGFGLIVCGAAMVFFFK
ncbi:DMT family protein [Caulobacter segnis]|nr:DMT family protein [Caulobacter segnis]